MRRPRAASRSPKTGCRARRSGRCAWWKRFGPDASKLLRRTQTIAGSATARTSAGWKRARELRLGRGHDHVMKPAFTRDQLDAVDVSKRHLDACVVAGPGSGKTTVLVEYFGRLVASGVDPLRILAITFTEKAA